MTTSKSSDAGITYSQLTNKSATDEATHSLSNSFSLTPSNQSPNTTLPSQDKSASSQEHVLSLPYNSMSSQDLSLDSLQQSKSDIFCQSTDLNGKSSPERTGLLQNPENGRFLPGNPGGPGGRVVSPTAAYRKILAEKGAEPLAQTVYNDALTAKSARDRLAAASEITDRVDGKATQRVDMRGIVVMMPAQADLEALDSWAGDEE